MKQIQKQDLHKKNMKLKKLPQKRNSFLAIPKFRQLSVSFFSSFYTLNELCETKMSSDEIKMSLIAQYIMKFF